MAKRILITSDAFGKADTELGRILVRGFLVSLSHAEEPPAAVMLVNEGVRLACEGSRALDELQALADSGVRIASCGTCLKHLGLADSLAVGAPGTMPDLVDAVLGQDDIVTIG